MAEKFEIRIADGVLMRVRQRIEAFRFPPEPEDAGWEFGTPRSFLQRVRQHFLEEFDWRAVESELNSLPHYRVAITGLSLHFIHARSAENNAVPLLLLHGWPGSIVEFVSHLKPLTTGSGASRGEPTYDVVVPSLPGFGFSDVPSRPLTPREIAGMMHRLMTEELGYARYAVHGGDWGSMIAGWLGYDYPEACLVVHWTMMGLSPGGDAPGLTVAGVAQPDTDEERAWVERAAGVSGEFAYAAIQSTKPQTLGYAMSDSPMGALAWILEKFHGWSDRRGRPVEDLFDLDILLTNAMLYILTDRFVSASWMYRSLLSEGNALPPGERILVPVALAALPHDILPPPPETYVRKIAGDLRYRRMPRGGHFLSLEQPDLWMADLRTFLKEHYQRLTAQASMAGRELPRGGLDPSASQHKAGGAGHQYGSKSIGYTSN